jgi:deoxyribodipyrimidine photo-lyase
MIHQDRVLPLNDKTPRRGRFVAYWMQASQRAAYNHALEYAIRAANARREPMVAVFVLTDDYPEANLRSYMFMLEGLRDTQATLRSRGVDLVVLHGSPQELLVEALNEASILVTDCGYTRVQRRAWDRARISNSSASTRARICAPPP